MHRDSFSRFGRLAFLCVAGLGGLTTSANAGLISVSGQGDILVATGPPANTGATANFFNDGTAQSPALVHGWDELQGVALGANIVVDAVAVGLYDQASDLGSHIIARGTHVNSHLLYFDPRAGASAEATFTFDGDIIGVILESDRPGDDRFRKTDFLGNPLTIYPVSHFDNRGLEFNTDLARILPGRRSLLVRLTASNPGDQIRVLTAVPEPATVVSCLMPLALGGLAIARRRLRAS